MINVKVSIKKTLYMWKRLSIIESYDKETKNIPINFNENKVTC